MAFITNNAPNTKRPLASKASQALTTYATQFHWTSATLSNVGLVRAINEDATLDQSARGLWAVADGMGGHARGDLASRMVIEAVNKVPPSNSLSELIAATRDRLLTVNSQLRTEATNMNVHIIGSTVVVLIACDRYCAYVWAGDSRIYLYRNGNLRQLTRDHSQVEELKASGNADSDAIISHTPRNLITRAVGAHDTLDLDEQTLEVNDGDMFLLCSDGLSNEVSEQEMGDQLATGNCRQAAQALMDMALMNGGRDNISIVVVHAEDLTGSDRTVVNPML